LTEEVIGNMNGLILTAVGIVDAVFDTVVLETQKNLYATEVDRFTICCCLEAISDILKLL
jgi:hypothetical protein